MILKQYYLGCLAHASYLIADEASGRAVVVDPQRDVDQYLQDAAVAHLTVEGIFLTHFHADFVAGHLELRQRTGATIYLGETAQAEYPFTPLADRQCLDIGAVRLQVLATPGHTPEGISIVVYDQAVAPDKPHAVLTGDTLFIGDVGRPDLMASVGVTADALAGLLYESLRTQLMTLPDETLVYPAHGAGSSCGKNLSKDTVSTIGAQKQLNYALQPMSKAAFIEAVTANQSEAPAYFAHDAVMNRKERPTLDESLAKGLRPLRLEDVLRLQNAGAQVVDVRESDDYALGHLADSLNLGLAGKFASWAGNVLDKERAIVLIADPEAEREAALRLGRIGYDSVAGYLDGGMAAVTERPDLVRVTSRISQADLVRALDLATPPVVLDVRGEGEWREAHIPGSRNIPLPKLEAQLASLPRDGQLIVHCASGYRSSAAGSILARAGFTNVSEFPGGFDAWQEALAES
ncbi:MAG: MBL fold metallo-hydrolase [Candidatus Sericytochromatia bacterium]|nr:MBL fold metallo-hydrolase [Candidatus Sericytochromatia bacterium]